MRGHDTSGNGVLLACMRPLTDALTLGQWGKCPRPHTHISVCIYDVRVLPHDTCGSISKSSPGRQLSPAGPGPSQGRTDPAQSLNTGGKQQSDPVYLNTLLSR